MPATYIAGARASLENPRVEDSLEQVALRLLLELRLRYTGASLIRKRPPSGTILGPYCKILGGLVFSYERRTPVGFGDERTRAQELSC